MEKAFMKNQVEFKVGDTVLIKHYDKELALFWDENTIGDTTKVVEECSDGCFRLSNGYAYHPSELEFVSEGTITSSRKKDTTLTQPELQFLTKFLAKKIESIEDDWQFYKGKVAHTWNYCIPNTLEAYLEFPRLNYLKTEVRKRKELLKKFSEIQGKLKRQVGK